MYMEWSIVEIHEIVFGYGVGTLLVGGKHKFALVVVRLYGWSLQNEKRLLMLNMNLIISRTLSKCVSVL